MGRGGEGRGERREERGQGTEERRERGEERRGEERRRVILSPYSYPLTLGAFAFYIAVPMERCVTTYGTIQKKTRQK